MSWSWSDQNDLDEAKRRLARFLVKRDKNKEDLLEMAALQLKISNLEKKKAQAEEVKRRKKEQEALRRELERQRREMRRKLVASGFAKFFKKARPQVTRLVTKLIKSGKTAELNAKIQKAIHQVYGVKVNTDIQKEMLHNKAYWVELAFYLIMPEAKLLGLERQRFAALTDFPLLGRIVKWYRKRKNQREYQDLYRLFERKIRKASKSYAVWFTAQLADLALKLQKALKKAYKKIALGEEIRLNTTMGAGHSRVVRAAVLSLAHEVTPDVQISHTGIRFKAE